MELTKDKKKNEEILEETYENYKDIENLMFFVDKYLYYEEVILGKSSNTIRSYRRDILQFMEYIDEYEEIRTFEDVEMLTIRSFIAYLNSDERLKKKKNAKKLRELVFTLCSEQFVTKKSLAKLLGMTESSLWLHLREFVAQGMLELAFPQQPTHKDQSYRVVK